MSDEKLPPKTSPLAPGEAPASIELPTDLDPSPSRLPLLPPVIDDGPRLLIQERFENPHDTLEMMATCDNCGKGTIVKIPALADAPSRQRIISEALEEHRFFCPVGTPAESRVYRLTYPRK